MSNLLKPREKGKVDHQLETGHEIEGVSTHSSAQSGTDEDSGHSESTPTPPKKDVTLGEKEEKW